MATLSKKNRSNVTAVLMVLGGTVLSGIGSLSGPSSLTGGLYVHAFWLHPYANRHRAAIINRAVDSSPCSRLHLYSCRCFPSLSPISNKLVGRVVLPSEDDHDYANDVRRYRIVRSMAYNDNYGDYNDHTPHHNSNSNSNSNSSSTPTTIVDRSLPALHSLLHRMRTQIHLEHQLQHPPNSNLSPVEFVSSLLQILRDPDDPLPDAGYRTLLRSSSPRWYDMLRRSVGAPPLPLSSSSAADSTCYSYKKEEEEDKIARALGVAMSRPNNQFGILVGAEDAEEYTLLFPNSSNEGYHNSTSTKNSNESKSARWEEVDVLDYEDGTCWVVCELRETVSGRLLVILGWELVRSTTDRRQIEYEKSEEERGDYDASNGAWLIESLDWQDFRDAYRPGIGREEWVRICG